LIEGVLNNYVILNALSHMTAIQQQQPWVNNKALAWTVGVHALLLLLLIFIGYNITPAPPVADGGGLEVNLGTSETGSGKDQPMSAKDPAAYQAAVVYKSVAVKSSVPKDMLRSTEADAPEVNTTNKKKGKTEENVKGRQVQEKPKYMYAGDKGPGGNSALQNQKGKSEGQTTGPGDQGVPGGTPGAANYAGIPGNGTGGIGHTLSGRTISPRTFEAEFHESGKVVIHVTVDRNGNITDKRVKSSSSPQLTRIALEKLDNAHFSKSEGPEPQQFGDVTITFVTRQ
jgi:TonB family protein